MAYQPPSVRQEMATRKILEELQLKKQMLLKQGVAPTLSSQNLSSIPMGGGLTPDAHMMSSAQRTALQNANSQSYGFFITQDSSFGNLILPVLPRFEPKP
ncbi:SOSS complex subunit C homolog [Bacillus rossius redtenbacheri]|uniref:SOSS complex subunit C homolog n=1 Tax=Bacillus rossius redtenbacheri TaxID=93214 RepID=UPI002FDEF0D0